MTSSRIEMTYKLAHAAAHDAANRNMRRAGRVVWNEDDWNVAVECFNQLWPLHLEEVEGER